MSRPLYPPNPGALGAGEGASSGPQGKCKSSLNTLWILSFSCVALAGCPPPISDQRVNIRVMLASPVHGAVLSAWEIAGEASVEDDPDIVTIELAGTDIALEGNEIDLGWATTDERGEATVQIGLANRLILFEAFGGWTFEPGVDREPGREPSNEIDLGGFAMYSALVMSLPTEFVPERSITISPLTSAAHAMALGRTQASSNADLIRRMPALVRRTNDLVSEHVGEDIVQMRVLDITDSEDVEGAAGTVSCDEDEGPLCIPGMKNGLALAALAGIGRQIEARRAGSGTGEPIGSQLVAEALVQDGLPRLADPNDDFSALDARLDGIGPDGPISIGSCERACDVDANTWRAGWAGALAFEVIASDWNATGLTLEDARPMVRAMAENTRQELFPDTDQAPIAAIDIDPPIVTFDTTQVADELYDDISFTQAAEPVHEATVFVELGPERVSLPSSFSLGSSLGRGSSGEQNSPCPTVHKYITRLDDPTENAIRWQFSVFPRPGLEATLEGAEFRVRAPSGSMELVTDWLPARVLGDTVSPDETRSGLAFEAVLLSSDIPELAKVGRGIFEIEVRGEDSLGQKSTVRGCWEHVLLPPPLQIASMQDVPISNPRSLHNHDLVQNNLGEFLNQDEQQQRGLELVEVEIRNGTEYPGFIQVGFSQSAATVVVNWQRVNTLLFETTLGYADCLLDGSCYQSFPPHRQNVVVEDDVRNVQLATSVEVWDNLTNQPLSPCEPSSECSSGIFRLEPRINPAEPRVYRAVLIARDLSALAPILSSEDDDDVGGPYEEFTLDPAWPLKLSGRAYGRVVKCSNTDPITGLCNFARVHSYHRSLSSASIAIQSSSVIIQSSVTSTLPPRRTMTIEHQEYFWSTTEPIVPPVAPL